MKIQTPETEEDATREELEHELLDLIIHASEAKRINTLFRDQLQTKGLSSTLKELDSTIDCDLSPESQEILEMFKLQAARSVLQLKGGSSDNTKSDDTYRSDAYSYASDDGADDEADEGNPTAFITLTRSNSLVTITLEDIHPIAPQILDVPITGGDSSYSRDCCALDTSHCVIL